MNIIGHISIRKILKRLATMEVGPQSFLFSGPRGVGKRPVAEEFSVHLRGDTDTSDRDLMIIEPEKETRENRERETKIPIEAIREAGTFLSLFPEQGKRRVLIIDDAHQLTVAAQNSLLKILEEPNSTACIMLVTHEPGRLFPTLLSRLFSITFQALKAEEIHESMPGARHIPDFFSSLGLPGIIREATEMPERFEAKKGCLRELFQLSRLSWKKRMDLAEILSQDEKLALDVLDIWLLGLRKNADAVFARGQAATYFRFLESVLVTRERLLSKEGSSRLQWESLFARV